MPEIISNSSCLISLDNIDIGRALSVLQLNYQAEDLQYKTNRHAIRNVFATVRNIFVYPIIYYPAKGCESNSLIASGRMRNNFG